MNFHFIAIGGSAMHSLAIALKEKGYKISGSDDVIYGASKSALEKHNLMPQELGWFPQKITANLDAVILGMHAKPNNPELQKAENLGLKIYSYPEFLYESSKEKTRVVIAGSHGKPTITAMVLHVMNYHGKEVDYLIGAPVPGFSKMLNLTQENDFIVIEGDEYFASALEKRPKFHFYKPNIALVSGIAWYNNNTFPTFEDYVEQFQVFIDSIVNGGILVYNQEDEKLQNLVENAQNPIRKHPYYTPQYHVEEGECILDTPEGEMPLEIFGRHNMSNLAGAKWICQHMGIDEDDFYEAIVTFKGASKRLEKIFDNGESIVFKDFAHSPSKIAATTKALKEQFPQKKLIACLELHTYSSLNREFLKGYANSLSEVDKALVFYSPEASQQRNLEKISSEEIRTAFQKDELEVFEKPSALKEKLQGISLKNSVLLFMSSGNFGGIEPENLIS